MKFKIPILFFVSVTLLMMSTVGLVFWSANTEQQGFYMSQQRLFESEVHAAGHDVEAFVNSRRSSVRAFANDNEGLISRLAVTPDDTSLKNEIGTRLKGRFPGYFAFTIASPNGQDLLDDFGEFIGQKCELDIKNFAAQLTRFKTGKFGLSEAEKYIGGIHPQPGNYHFDIMVPWRRGAELKGIFFVSFFPKAIQKTLSHYENHKHNLLLIKNDNNGLIEITKKGTREDFFNDRELNLSPEEMESIQAQTEIKGTQWLIASYPDSGFFDSAESGIWLRARLIIFAVCIVWIAAIFLAGILEGKRRQIAIERELTAGVLVQNSSELEFQRSALDEHAIVSITDVKGVIIYVNEKFCEISGYSKDELLGQNHRILKSDEHSPEFHQNIWRTVANKKNMAWRNQKLQKER